jgi:hypothetical protein
MFKLLTDSLFIAISRSNWLHSRKYGTVWYHPASSRFLSVYFQPLLVSGKIDWHASGFNAQATCVKPADSACCVLSVRCWFYVNTLQQEEEPKQSSLQKGNQDRKPLSKDDILNCIIRTEQERPKYKPGAPMLSEANLEAVQAWCTYVVRSKLRGCWTKLCQVACLCHGTQ